MQPSSDVLIYLAEPPNVAAIWPKIAPYIRAAMARSSGPPLWDEWDIKKAILQGQWYLWVAIDAEREFIAAVVTRIADYPRARLYDVPYIGGRDMRRWLAPMMNAIEAHARQSGAVAMQGFGRRGWCRVAGYREAYSVFVKDLA